MNDAFRARDGRISGPLKNQDSLSLTASRGIDFRRDGTHASRGGVIDELEACSIQTSSRVKDPRWYVTSKIVAAQLTYQYVFLFG